MVLFDDAKRDEVRKIILSLLLARPGTTAVPVLDNDYYEAEGERIPWKKFGYANIVDFLQSMPQHFSIEQRNSCHYVRGFASEKSKHVSSLVSRQRSTKGPPKYIPPRSRNNYNFPNLQRRRIRIPAEQLNKLVQYVRNYPDGVSIQTALLVIQQQLPHVIFSVYDVQEQLREMAHQLYIDGELIRPIYPLYSERYNSRAYQGNVNYQPPKPPLLMTPPIPPLLLMSPVPPSLGQTSLSQPSLGQPSFPQKNVASSLTEVVYGVPGDESDGSDLDEFVPAGCINQPLRRPKTAERIGASFNHVQDINYHDGNNDDEPEYFADTEATAYAENNDVSSLISDRVRSRLHQLIQKHPEGIRCAELPEMYFREYNVSLNYTDLGFNSVREYVAYLPKIFFMTREGTHDDFILYSAEQRPSDQEMPKDHNQETSNEHVQENISRTEAIEVTGTLNLHNMDDDDDDAPCPADVSPTICAKFEPNGVMSYNDCVGQILVTDLQNTKEYLEVYVVEIFTPSFFWVQLRGNKKHFEVFMEDLRDFYEHQKEMYTIPKVALKRGLNCACIYNHIWHRGIIKSVKPDFKVTVLFYDYGTLKTYEPEDIYYLHKQFSYLPAQAIPCGLYNVKPCVGDRWKKSITDRFIDRISDHLLAATIASVDPPNNSMLIILSDTSEEEDVHINDWLVQENLARSGKMGNAVDMASIMNYVVNNLNQLPTYCYAEESLVADSRTQATSTEEIQQEVPLISPGSSFTRHDQQSQPRPRPPPGFDNSDTSVLTNNLYSNGPLAHENLSNVKTLLRGDENATNNPFLDENLPQSATNVADIDPIEIAKQIYTQVWNENMQLQFKLIKMFHELLKHSPMDNHMYNSHIEMQHHFNNILKMFEKTLIINHTVSNLSRNGISNDNCVPITPLSTNSFENFMKQKVANATPGLSVTTNPFGDILQKPDHYTVNDLNNCLYRNYVHNNVAKSACHGSAKWNLTDELKSLHVQVPPMSPSSMPSTSPSSVPPMSPSFVPPMFNNYGNVPSMTPAASGVNISNIDRNLSNLYKANNEFLNMSSQYKQEERVIRKETNPFKLSLAGEIQILQTQHEHANGHDTTISTSHFFDKNLQNQTPKMESQNVHATDYNFSGAFENPTRNGSTGNFVYTGCNSSINDCNNYTSRIVYEAGPVMYNTQKNQTKTNITRQTSNYSGDTSAVNDEGYVTPTQNANGWNLWSQNDIKISPEHRSAFFSTCNKSMNNFLFHKIDLVKGVTIIFHMEEDGWILMHEFMEGFTHLKSCSHMISLFEAMNVPFSFKEIQRSDYPVQFLQLDDCPLNVARDSENHITSINLISLPTALGLLCKLKIISREEMDSALKKNEFVNGSVMHNMWVIINAYKSFRQRIAQNYQI